MYLVEIFVRFFALGCISFGGPAAHIGYFQTTFVQKLGWITQAEYARIVALSQFLPGPASSQVGFAIGMNRGGLLGGFAAFLGFTLPSFGLMIALAISAANTHLNTVLDGAITGLKLLAVVVVADAILSMFASFCKSWKTRFSALATAFALLALPSLNTQLALIAIAATLGAAFGYLTNKSVDAALYSEQTRARYAVNWFPLVLFCVLFGLSFIANSITELRLFADFYQAGSLVFGGGHVVLPLLQHTVTESLTDSEFITGYAAAQAVPGPMFTLATYLGALISDTPLVGAVMATLGIFLPGFLLIIAFQDSWSVLMKNPTVAGAAAAVNASVVGFIIAAFYRPVFVSAVTDNLALILCLCGLLAVRLKKCSILVLLIVFIPSGYLLN